MKLTQALTFGLAALAVTAIAVYIFKSSESRRILNQISDEGYETANDILFPGKKIKAKHLHYGPVIPS